MKLIIINKMHATPAMFRTYEQAYEGVKNLMHSTTSVEECRVVSYTTLEMYVNEKYGEDFYTEYSPCIGEWVINEFGVSGNGESVDWELFSKWFEEEGLK